MGFWRFGTLEALEGGGEPPQLNSPRSATGG